MLVGWIPPQSLAWLLFQFWRCKIIMPCNDIVFTSISRALNILHGTCKYHLVLVFGFILVFELAISISLSLSWLDICLILPKPYHLFPLFFLSCSCELEWIILDQLKTINLSLLFLILLEPIGACMIQR